MRVSELLEGLPVVGFTGDPGTEVFGLQYDSRAVVPGDLFVAVEGHRADGHVFIPDALLRGAVGVVCSGLGERAVSGGQGVRIFVKDTREALYRLARRFYGDPAAGLTVIGITGTNGKTTTTYILEAILRKSGRLPGVVGTINYRFGDCVLKAPVTTPESLDLMRLLRRMKDSGVTDLVMEVSSHALDQGRVRGCPFQVAVFTNLSRDHLDYHGTMDAYFAAKRLLFTGLGDGAPALGVINMDDPRGAELRQATKGRVMTYGISEQWMVHPKACRMSREGLRVTLASPQGPLELQSRLMGEHNLYNLMGAIAAALGMGIAPSVIAQGVEDLTGVPGRLERVPNPRGLLLVVDYAHTPDALRKAMEAVRSLTGGRLVTVFGCGGERDRGKRREMGRVAATLCDRIALTSDNPRTEDPAAIAEMVEEGLREAGAVRVETLSHVLSGPAYVVELDREKAIALAVDAAGEGDGVLIAGKGHEDYQILGTTRRSFDDRIVAAACAGGKG